MAVLPPDPVFCLRCTDMGSVNSICFHDSERLLAGTIKGSVFLWDLQTNRSTLHFNVGNDPILSIHHTKAQLITQEKGGKVTIWSIANASYVRERSLPGKHLGYCRSVLYNNKDSGDEELLFYADEDNAIGVLNLNDAAAPPKKLLSKDPKLPTLGTLQCFKPFAYGTHIYVLAGYESGHFLTWDLTSGTVVNVLALEADPMAVDYDANTNRGIVGGPTEKLIAISYQRQSMQLKRGTEISIKNPGVNCVRIRNDQKVFAIGCWDSRVRIFSWKSLRPLAVLTQHKQGGVMDIAYSDAKVAMWHAPIMAAAGMDSQISLWDLYN